MKDYRNRKDGTYREGISRRSFLKLGLATMASQLIPFESMAAVDDFSKSRSLFIYHPDRKEYINDVYFSNGKYITSVLNKIDYLFRDNQNGQIITIHNNLIDTLSYLQKSLNTRRPFHIISGYRSPNTNAELRKKQNGVAKNSLHMYGMAADIRLTGYDLKLLRRSAIKLHAGGVGYYPQSKFIHLDIGKVRYW